MSIAFSVLGSGSGGNCSVVILDRPPRPRHILIDAGLSTRQTQKRLERFRVGLDQISDILVTHMDQDHFYPAWARAAEKFRIRVHIHRRHRSRALRTGICTKQLRLFDNDFALDEFTTIETTHLAHDQDGTVGFVLDHQGLRLGWATDLGRVPASLFSRYTGLHALAFESNYDRRMQEASERHPWLKRRIMGGAGHLSNRQSLAAVRKIAAQSDLSQLVLLHLSRECNTPAIVEGLYAEHAPHLADRLTVSNQTESTPLLQVSRDETACRIGEQMVMFER